MRLFIERFFILLPSYRLKLTIRCYMEINILPHENTVRSCCQIRTNTNFVILFCFSKQQCLLIEIKVRVCIYILFIYTYHPLSYSCHSISSLICCILLDIFLNLYIFYQFWFDTSCRAIIFKGSQFCFCIRPTNFVWVLNYFT